MTPQEAIAIENQIGRLLNEAEANIALCQSKLYEAKGLITEDFLALYDDHAASKGIQGIDKAVKAIVVAKARLAEGHHDADEAMATATFLRPRGGGK